MPPAGGGGGGTPPGGSDIKGGGGTAPGGGDIALRCLTAVGGPTLGPFTGAWLASGDAILFITGEPTHTQEGTCHYL